MHPAYTLYICLEARVAEWKNNVYATLNKAFAVPTDAWIQLIQVRCWVGDVEDVCLRYAA